MSTDTKQTPDVRGGHTHASNALADSLCPGRHLAQRGIPDSTTVYSESGQKIHAALAAGTRTDGGRAELDALSLEERHVYDQCITSRSKLVERLFGNITGRPYTEYREQRMWARFKFNGTTYEHSGQPDWIARCETRALIVDYKTLPGDVEDSPRNMQLRDLACLLAGTMVPTTEVSVAIIQPLVTMDPEVCTYDKESLQKATRDMFTRVVASNDPKSKRVPGEAQCKYCKAKRRCVEYQKWAGQITPPAMVSILSVPMESWSPEQCAYAAGALGPCQKFLDELKDMLKARLEKDPQSVPGWFLKPGSVREAISNPSEVFKRFVALGGNTDQFMPAINVMKTKLREAINSVTGAKGKALDTAMAELIKGCVDQTRTAPSLYPVKKEGES